jgi:hypothetical protein
MFVRWQQYRSKAQKSWVREWKDGHSRIKAILLESVRIDGKPRQRHIAFLGSIGKAVTNRKEHRPHFWADIRQRLDHLGNRITADDRAKIEAALAKRVPPLTASEQAEWETEQRRLARLLRWG